LICGEIQRNSGLESAGTALERVMNFGWRFVGLKTGCRQGAARAHPRMGLKASRNAAASPFSTQPSGKSPAKVHDTL